jgi:hypothetical protein
VVTGPRRVAQRLQCRVSSRTSRRSRTHLERERRTVRAEFGRSDPGVGTKINRGDGGSVQFGQSSEAVTDPFPRTPTPVRSRQPRRRRRARRRRRMMARRSRDHESRGRRSLPARALPRRPARTGQPREAWRRGERRVAASRSTRQHHAAPLPQPRGPRPTHVAGQHQIIPQRSPLIDVDERPHVVVGGVGHRLLVHQQAVPAIGEVIASRRSAPADPQRQHDPPRGPRYVGSTEVVRDRDRTGPRGRPAHSASYERSHAAKRTTVR